MILLFVCCLLFFPLFSGAAEEGYWRDLAGALDEEGIAYEERAGGSLFARLPGGIAGASEPPLVLAIRAFPFGIETGLWFLRKSKNDRHPPILAAFLEEENASALEDLSAALEDPENTPLLYLDLEGLPQKLHVHHGSAGYNSPLSLLRPLTDLLSERRIPYTAGIRRTGLYRLRLAEGIPAMGFVQSLGIPALAITGETGILTQEALTAEKLGEILAEYSAAGDFSFEDPDIHYSLFTGGNRVWYLSEDAAVGLLFFTGGLCLIVFLGYSVIFRRRIRLLWSRGLVFFWVGPLLFGVLLCCCMGTGLFLKWIMRGFGAPLERLRLGGAGLVMLSGGFLFSLAVFPLRRLPLKGGAGLYGNTAVFMTIPGLLGGIFLDISFSPDLLWIFLCAFLGASFKRPLLVLLCAALSLFAPLMILADSSGTGRFMTILQPRYALFFLGFTALTLPFYLLFIRATLLFRRRFPWRRRLFPRLILSALVLGALFFYGYRQREGASQNTELLTQTAPFTWKNPVNLKSTSRILMIR